MHAVIESGVRGWVSPRQLNFETEADWCVEKNWSDQCNERNQAERNRPKSYSFYQNPRTRYVVPAHKMTWAK